MLTENELGYYGRQIILDELGAGGQQKLKSSSVLIVGVGGLGCPIGLYLASMGVGRIVLMDDDIISLSNLNRQVLFAYDDIGKRKADVAREKLKSLNPYVIVESITENMTEKNAVDLIRKFDIIVDGSDNFRTKYLINDACIVAKKPWVFGSIYKFQGQVSLFNYEDGPTYRCLFNNPSNLDSCSVIGVLGVLPGMIGTVMANEVLKVLTQIGNTLSGRLLVINALDLRFTFHNIVAIKENQKINDIFPGQILPNVIKKDEIKQNDFLIDVRSPGEHKIYNIGGINIPVEEILENIGNLKDIASKGKRIVFYCKTGVRSKNVMKLAQDKGIDNAFSLDGGL